MQVHFLSTVRAVAFKPSAAMRAAFSGMQRQGHRAHTAGVHAWLSARAHGQRHG